MAGAETAASGPRGRRAQILDAALAAFTEHGVAGAPIEEIRRRSGASVGSIYHHFGGKDGIAGALYLDGLDSYQRGFLAALETAPGTRAGVEGGVRHHLAWVSAHPDLARFLLLGRDARVIVATERPLRERNRRFLSAVRRWCKPRVAAGELRDLAPELTTALWIGPSQELSRHWLAREIRMQLTDAGDVLAPAAWTSLKEAT